MDKELVDKILAEIGDKIKLLLQRRGSKDFDFYFVEVARDTFQGKLVFGFSPMNGNDIYEVTFDFGGYSIFYSLDELTYSESHLGVTLDTPEEERVIKRILTAVGSLHEGFRMMQESYNNGGQLGKAVGKRIEGAKNHVLHFYSTGNGSGLRLGGVSLNWAE